VLNEAIQNEIKRANELTAEIDALAGALGSAAVQANEYADSITRGVAAQRKVIDAVLSGTTSDQAQQSIRALQDRIALEKALQTELERQRSTLDVTSPAFAALTKEINALRDGIAASESQVAAYNTAIRDGAFAQADAKAAAAKAAEEEAARARQREALQKRLAESRAKREAERAKREAEITAFYEKGAAVQQKFADSVKKAQQAYTDAVQKAEQTRTQKLVDLRRAFDADVQKLEVEAGRRAVETTRKAEQERVDAITDTRRRVEDINQKALDSEEDAAQSRNILRIREIRKQQSRELRDAATATKRVLEDQEVQLTRQRELDRLAAEQALIDRRVQFEQQRVEAQIAYTRELEQARQVRERALLTARQVYNQELSDLSNYGRQRLGIMRDIMSQELAMLGQLRNTARLSAANTGGNQGRQTNTTQRVGGGANSRASTNTPASTNTRGNQPGGQGAANVLKRAGYG
jgi:hypothetical protein